MKKKLNKKSTAKKAATPSKRAPTRKRAAKKTRSPGRSSKTSTGKRAVKKTAGRGGRASTRPSVKSSSASSKRHVSSRKTKQPDVAIARKIAREMVEKRLKRANAKPRTPSQRTQALTALGSGQQGFEKCTVCGRRITNPIARVTGVGMTCAKKQGGKSMRTSHVDRIAQAQEEREEKAMASAAPPAESGDTSPSSNTPEAKSASDSSEVSPAGGEDVGHDQEVLQPRGPGQEEASDTPLVGMVG